MNKKQLKAKIDTTGNAVKDAAAAAGEKLHGAAEKVDAKLHGVVTKLESTIKRYRHKTAQKLADASEKVEN